MEAKFYISDVLPTLSQALSVTNAKNALPILECFQISFKGDYAVVTTSDSEIWYSAKVNIESDEERKLCIHASQFVNALRNIDQNTIVRAKIDFSTTTATFVYDDKGSYFKLPFTTDEYPTASVDTTNISEYKFPMPQSFLAEAIDKVVYAVSYDSLRPIMNGVHFDFKQDGLVTVASNAVKLGRFKNKSITHEMETSPSLTLSLKAANILKSILVGEDNVLVCFNNNYIVVTCEKFKFLARLVEGVYPKYEAVIPKESNITVNIPKTDLLSALKRVSPMGNTTDELIQFHFNTNILTIRAENIDFNTSAEESMACEYYAAELFIGFKSSTLMDTLRNINSEIVAFDIIDPTRAVVLHAEDKERFLALVMPMKL